MNIPRRYIRVATVLTIALTTGHLMQNGSAIAARLGVGDHPALTASDPSSAPPQTLIATLSTPREGAATALSFIPGAADLHPLAPQPTVLAAPLGHPAAGPDVTGDAGPVVLLPLQADGCAPLLTATAAAGALVRLVVAAPCDAGARVTVRHAGLAFRGHTDASGLLTLEVPALEQTATFDVVVAGGSPLSATVAVPDLRDYDRVAVIWDGPASLTLGTGDGNQGTSMSLGDAEGEDVARAKVYSVAAARPSVTIGAILEAQVTAETCDTTITARTVQSLGGMAPSEGSVNVTMPDCGAVGDYLRVGDLFGPLKVAEN